MLQVFSTFLLFYNITFLAQKRTEITKNGIKTVIDIVDDKDSGKCRVPFLNFRFSTQYTLDHTVCMSFEFFRYSAESTFTIMRLAT